MILLCTSIGVRGLPNLLNIYLLYYRLVKNIVYVKSPLPRNAGTLKTIVCSKRLHWQSCRLGGSHLFMKYDVFRQNADFF